MIWLYGSVCTDTPVAIRSLSFNQTVCSRLCRQQSILLDQVQILTCGRMRGRSVVMNVLQDD